MGGGRCFVDLSASEEDDDDDLVCLTEFPAHLAHRAPRKSVADVRALLNADLVILEDVEKSIELHCEVGVERPSQRSSQNSSVLDDDCCILDEDPSKVEIGAKASCGNDSDDLVMTGEIGDVACRDFPHARHLCVQFPFKMTAHKAFCSQCHCYVCDTVAPCAFWGDGTRGGDHCHASDKFGERWKLLRQINRSRAPGCSDLLTQEQASATAVPLAGNREAQAASFRGLLGCHIGDSARSKYPLQITLNRPSRDSSMRSGRHYSPGLGLHMKSHNHKYVRRKEPNLSSTCVSLQSEVGVAAMHRRSSRENVPFLGMHTPHSSSSPSSTQSSKATFAAVLPRRPVVASTATVQEESLDTVQYQFAVSDSYYCREQCASPAFLASHRSDSSREMQLQCRNTETISGCPLNFEDSTPQSQNENRAYGGQRNGTVESCNSLLEVELEPSRLVGLSESKFEGSFESLPPSPPTLLVDYLVDGEFWNDTDFPEDFL